MIFKSCLISACVLFASVVAEALPGDLDPTFGNGGKVITDYGENHEITCLALQNDGRIIAAGSSRLGSAWVLARYLPDGTLDSTFGAGGTTFTNFGDSYTYCSSMAVAADGRIILAGKTGGNAEQCDFAVACYLPDGTLDTGFGDNGGRVIPSAGGRGAASVLIQKDGKIVVTGAGESREKAVILIRYDAKGVLDEGFGSHGVTTIGFPRNFWDSVESGTGKSVLQSDGKIVVAGALRSRFVLARINPNGTRDGTFLWNDPTKELLTISPQEINCLFVGKNDRLTISAGLVNETSSYPRLSSYGKNGMFMPSPVSAQVPQDCPNSPTAVAMDGDGSLLIAGGYDAYNDNQFFSLARFKGHGSPDSAFGRNGVSTAKFGRFYDVPHAMLIQPDGKIITAGYSEISPERGAFALARHMGGQIRPDLRVGRYKDAKSKSLGVGFPAAGATKRIYIVVRNDGSTTDSFTVKGSRGDKNFKLRYFRGSVDVTKSVVKGTYTTLALKPAKVHRLKLEITTVKTKKILSDDFVIQAVSNKSRMATDEIGVHAYCVP